MTNQNEIIVDDVDVSECKYKFQNKEKYDGDDFCTLYLEKCKFLGEAGICDDNCQVYEDYKQLKRLEQENEKLTKKLQKYENMRTKGLEEFKDVGGCWGCGLQLQLNQDIEDIKKLKQNAQDTYDMYKALMKSFEISNSERSKYKQTLEEIKIIVNGGICSNCAYQRMETDCTCKSFKILTKINEVLS